MSTIKISQLPQLPAISSNTSNTLFLGVDTPSGVTGKFTATTLAQQLYANNALNVGNNQILFSNTVGQFSGTDGSFLQVNMQNFNANGSGDFVITGDQGTNFTNYIDLGLNGSNFTINSTVGTAFKSNDGYLYVQGPTWTPGHPYQGNLVIGTASSNTKTYFISGGANTENIVGYIDNTGLHFANIENEISANLVVAKAYTDTANTKLKSYSDNKFLANTSGTFGGDLDVAGTFKVNSVLTIAASDPSASPSISSITTENHSLSLKVGATSTWDFGEDGSVVFPGGPKLNTQTGVTTLNGPSGGYMVTQGKQSNGTAAGSVQLSGTTGSVRLVAYLDNDNAGAWEFKPDLSLSFPDNTYQTTAFTGTAIDQTARNTANSALANTDGVQTAGSLKVTGAFYAANTIRTPTVYAGSQTAINLSFTNSALQKVNTNSGLTVTLSNFVAGKFIELYITNTDNSQHSITHGCSAINSSMGATSFNLAATRTAYLRYASFGTDLANTYVTATYS